MSNPVSNPVAFEQAVTGSESIKQQDLHSAANAHDGNYAAALRAAERAHWERVIEAGRVHNIRTETAQFALVQSKR